MRHRHRLLTLRILLGMSLLLSIGLGVGCGNGQGDPAAGPAQGPGAPGGTSAGSSRGPIHLAEVGLALRTADGVEALPANRKSVPQFLKQVARRAPAPHEVVRAQAEEEVKSKLFQWTDFSGTRPARYMRLAGLAEPFIAYAPSTGLNVTTGLLSQHLQVAPNDVHFQILPNSSGTLLNRWRVPPGTFVMGAASAGQFEFGGGDSSDGQVDVAFEYTVRDDPQDPQHSQIFNIVVLVEGQEVLATGEFSWPQGGTFPFLPTLRAHGPGNYTYEAYGEHSRKSGTTTT